MYKRILISFICWSVIFGCGGAGNSNSKVYVPNWCYVKSADWLLNGDIYFTLYNSIRLEWPRWGYVQEVFDTYNTNPCLQLDYVEEGDWVTEDLQTWKDMGYRMAFRHHSFTDKGGIKKYHIEPLIRIEQVNGLKEVSIFVSGVFNEECVDEE